ncbi:exported hypothetical protein [Candidatus Sulfopaludibacter sp. SbA4]|nr:exported hypothetical protein [Candidatus Sulfopaludibacter sp. SbA4]
MKTLLLLLGLAASAVAQVNTSTMDGLVTDQQGALVPKVEIAVTNILTGQIFRTLTDDKGHWAVPSLPTATYSVTATAAGFKKVTKEGIAMDAGIPATVNLTLEVGAVSETVQVTGAAEIVESASAAVSSDLTGRQVNDLPIPSRNATDLIVTLPGTQTPGGRGLPQDGCGRGSVGDQCRIGSGELGRRGHPGEVRHQVGHQRMARRRIRPGAQHVLRRQHLLQQY